MSGLHLDSLGVVGDKEGGASKLLLCEVALVFALQVQAPLHGKLKHRFGSLEPLYGLRVGDDRKRFVGNVLQQT